MALPVARTWRPYNGYSKMYPPVNLPMFGVLKSRRRLLHRIVFLTIDHNSLPTYSHYSLQLITNLFKIYLATTYQPVVDGWEGTLIQVYAPPTHLLLSYIVNGNCTGSSANRLHNLASTHSMRNTSDIGCMWHQINQNLCFNIQWKICHAVVSCIMTMYFHNP